MSLIHRIATLEMFRVAKQHEQSTEASHRRTNEFVSQQLNDITDQFEDLCEKHHALKKRDERAVAYIGTLLRELWGYRLATDALFEAADKAQPGATTREDLQQMVRSHITFYEGSEDVQKETLRRIENRLRPPAKA